MSADTAVLPPWKLAILNKKKQKEVEEQRKKDEEQAYLKSLPPWKRAIVLKNRATSGRPISPDSAKDRHSVSEVQRQTSPDHSSKVTSMAKTFLDGSKKQSPPPAPEMRPTRTSTTLKAKRASFESDTFEVVPLHSGPARSGSTASSSNKASTPAWKKKPVPDQGTGAPVANGGPQYVSPPAPEIRPVRTSSAVKAKRASFESDTVEVVPLHIGPAPSHGATTTSTSKTETPPRRKPFAIDKNSPDAPVANGGPLYTPPTLEPPAFKPQQRPRSKSDLVHPSSVSSRPVKSQAPVVAQARPRVNTQPARPVVRTASPEASTGGEKRGGDDGSLDHLPPWKREIILRKREKSQQGAGPPSTAGQTAVDGAVGSKHSSDAALGTVRKAQPSSNIFKLMPRVASPSHTLKENDLAVKMTTPPKQSPPVTMTPPPKQSPAATPPKEPVKKSVTMKHAVSAQVPTTRKQPLTNDHTAFTSRSAPIHPVVRTEERRLAPKTGHNTKKAEPPVNSMSSSESAVSPEQNPKELIPPVFPEVEPWSRVSEEDPAFKALPPWKQALILRRRHDIQLRSCAPEYLRLREEQQETTKVDKTEGVRVDTVWSPSNAIDMPNLRHVSRPEPQKSSKTEEEEAEEKIPPWKMDFIRNRRLKEQLRAEKEGTPAHHQIHVTGSEDDDDDVFTHIDDLEADDEYLLQIETDEVGELKEIQVRSPSSSSSSLSSASTQHSILVSGEKKRSSSGLGKRNVSWNDLHTTEHNYPRYTYDDYDEFNPEGVSGTSLPDEEDTDGGRREETTPSTPIHPSLQKGNIDPIKGGATMSSYTPSILASLSSFPAYSDPWASYNSSYGRPTDSATSTVKKEEKKEEPPPPPPEEIMPVEDDAMGGWGAQNSDLLW